MTLVPGMKYTSKLAAKSLVSGSATSPQLTASFTALNGPAEKGIAFELPEVPVDDTEFVPNDTSGNPTIESILPTPGMTGVHLDVVDVTAGDDIPEVFELKFNNLTSGQWDTWKELQTKAGAGQDVFVNTTSKKVM